MFLFLYTARIGNQIFDHLKIHQWFAAEEVHFEIPPCTRVFHQEI